MTTSTTAGGGTGSEPQQYYTVVDDGLMLGDWLRGHIKSDDEPIPMATDPRRVLLIDYVDSHEINADELVTNTCEPRARIAVLNPCGAVTDSKQESAPGRTCMDGWTVTSFLPITAAFGPNAARLVDLVTKAEKDLVNIAGTGTEEQLVYVDALAAVYEDKDSIVWDINSASMALSAAGVDDAFWRQIGDGAYGDEVLALAARDLIGTVQDWTWEAYDALTGPWRRAFPAWPVHPDDTDRQTSQAG